MSDIILKDYGWCQVIQRNDKYIIRYDGGDVTVKMMEEEINKTQFERAMLNQNEAEQVITDILKNKRR
jgi:hypothetical protein